MPNNFQQGNTRGAKLNGQQVIEIRERYATERGCTQGRLSRDYGVSVGTIANIVNGLTWQHLLRGQEPQVNRPPWRMPASQITEAELEASQRKLAELIKPRDDVIVKVPSLYEDPPPEAPGEPKGTGLARLQHEAEPTAKQQQITDELDKLEKGDS